MAHPNTSQSRQPPAPSDSGLDTICSITKSLNIRNPYRKYPPHGVPCPEGPNTFHLALRREKWWQMLQEHAIKEDVMMEKLRIEDERRERLKEVQEEEAEVELKKQRKDSLVVEEKNVGYVDAKGVGVGGGGDAAAASAICDSSEDEEEVQREVKERKKSVGKGKEKAHVHGPVRKVKPVGYLRTHARKGSGASCCGSKTSTS